jgi:hypothetical protein
MVKICDEGLTDRKPSLTQTVVDVGPPPRSNVAFTARGLAMADDRERRTRRPKRPVVYLTLVAVCAVVALGSAWEASHPAKVIGVVWRGRPEFTSFR